jgi:hypothetical protein
VLNSYQCLILLREQYELEIGKIDGGLHMEIILLNSTREGNLAFEYLTKALTLKKLKTILTENVLKICSFFMN